ncbi:MAG: hypothetical protein Kow0047_01570 [Anaerolineae bacterium]
MRFDQTLANLLFHQVDHGLLITDRQLIVRAWNPWLEAHTGRQAGEVVGRYLFELYPDLVTRGLDRYFQRALEGQTSLISQRFHDHLLPIPARGGEARRAYMPQTGFIVPVIEDGEITGVICIIRDVTERVERERELLQRIEVLKALHAIDRAILTLDSEECLHRIVRHTAQLLQVPLTAVLLPSGSGLRVAACTCSEAGSHAELVDREASPWRAVLTALAQGTEGASPGEMVTIADVQSYPQIKPLHAGSRSIAAVPLLIEGKPFGVLVVESSAPWEPSSEQRESLQLLSTQAAIAIHNAQLYAALEASERRYRLISELTSDYAYAFTVDEDGKLTREWIAGAFEKITGYSPEEAQARGGWPILIHPDDMPIALERERRLMSGEPDVSEFRIVRKDGEIRWLRDYGRPEVDPATGRVIRIYGAAQDITEQKAASLALAESEERFRSIFENATIGLYRTTPDGRILMANPALIRMLRFESFEELAQRNLESEGYAEGYSRQAFREQIERLGEVRGLESAWVRKDGTVLYVRESARAIRDAEGRILYYEGTVEDITEQKRAQRIGQALADLGHRLSSADTVRQAAQIIVDVADHLLGWDACTLDLYDAAWGTTKTVLAMDVIDGIRQEVRDSGGFERPVRTDLYRRVLAGEPQLVRRDKPDEDPHLSLTPFGDVSRRSAALMFVPIRHRQQTIGVLSIQSYQPGAYDEEDLRLLQALADHAAGALARIQAQEAQRASERKYRALVEHIPAVTYTLTADGDRRFVFVSPQIEELLGFSAEEWLSTPALWEQYVHPADRQRWQAELSLLSSERAAIDLEYRVIRRDGSTRWVHDRAVLVSGSEGEPEYILGIMQDVTRRRVIEQALEAERQNVRALFEVSHSMAQTLDAREVAERAVARLAAAIGRGRCGLFIRDLDSDRLRLVALTGASPEEVEASDQRLQLQVGVGLAGWVAQHQQSAYVPDVNQDPRWIRAQPADEEVRSAIALPLIAGDDLVGVLCWTTDVREPLSSEHLALLSAATGPIAVALKNAQLYDRLVHTNQQLEQAVKAREEMIQNVSHELRTPLTVIMGYLEILQTGLLGELDEDQKKALGKMVSAAHQLEYMVDRLLTLHTFQTGQRVLRQPLDIPALVKETAAAWSPQAEEKGLRLDQELTVDRPVIVRGDDHLLRQVLDNLIDNAIKFSRPGGHIVVRLSARDGEVLISVSDQGIGIAPEHLEHVFDLFYQVDASTTRQYGGMGIGLALCRRIVEAHGGRIWAESEGQGRGTTVTVALPLENPSPEIAREAHMR